MYMYVNLLLDIMLDIIIHSTKQVSQCGGVTGSGWSFGSLFELVRGALVLLLSLRLVMIHDVISDVIQCTLHLCIRGSLPFTQATVTCVCDDPYHSNISIVCVHSQRRLWNLMYHWTSVSHYMWCV